jgi:hypothetical protein
MTPLLHTLVEERPGERRFFFSVGVLLGIKLLDACKYNVVWFGHE